MNEQEADLQRPARISINPWKERFAENKSAYFTFQSDMNLCFKKDCEKFLLMFEEFKSFSFRAFAAVWETMSFSLIFAGQEFVDEMEWFMEASFFTLKKYLIFSESLYVQVGAFYMLYALYFKQLCSDKVKIRLTRDEYATVQTLVQKMEEREIVEFVAIFTLLKCRHAFNLVAKPRHYGLEGKFMWREKKLKNDIFPAVKKVDPVCAVTKTLQSEDFYGLQYLGQINQEYSKVLQEYGISDSPASRTASIVKDLEFIYGKMKGVSDEQDEKTDEGMAVHTKRENLRSKAFAADIPIVRTRKSQITYTE